MHNTPRTAVVTSASRGIGAAIARRLARDSLSVVVNYASSEAGAAETLTRVLAKELGPRGITVNAVAPGPVATDLLRNGRSEALLARLAQEIPLGRLGEPEDIARVVSFLAGPDGGWISGQVLRANGGRN